MASGVTLRRQASPAKDVLTKALEESDKVVAKVGWFSSAVYPDGTPTAYVAAIQEEGYPPKNIPPRLGMRATAAQQKAYWSEVATKAGTRIFAGKMSFYDAMTLIGGVAQGDIFKHISEVTSPPLAEATLKARASRRGIGVGELTATGAKPLNDTGYLIATLTHLVTENKGDGE